MEAAALTTKSTKANMKKKIVVIYHRADFDGIFCREIARKFLGNAAEYIGWDYGDPVPTPDQVSAEQTVYMLDISIDGLMGLPNLIWIDHHKSAIEKYTSPIHGAGKTSDQPLYELSGYWIDGVAACRLTWQWFFLRRHEGFCELMPSKARFVERLVIEPVAVQLAGEYDVWDKRNPDAETFQFGLRSKELTEEDWAWLLTVRNVNTQTDHAFVKTTITINKFLEDGKLLQRYQQEQDASVVKYRRFTAYFDGLTVLCLCTARCNSLTVAAAVKPEHDALMGFYWTGRSWKVSLYHAPGKEQHDLSEIAVKYGGGGHRGACGFEVKMFPAPFPAVAPF